MDLTFQAAATGKFSFGLYHGYTGMAWAVNFALRGFRAADLGIDIDAVSDLERIITSWAIKRLDGHFDLISGWVGIGLYALTVVDKNIGQELFRIVADRLVHQAKKDSHGTFWHTEPALMSSAERTTHPQGYVNLGLAHGVPGVVALLARAKLLGVTSYADEELLRTSLQWLLEAGEHADGLWYGQVLGSTWVMRTAWCYGDLGVAVSLTWAAIAEGSEELMGAARRLALRSLSRGYLEAGVRDSSVCHGAMGVAHIALRLYQSLGDQELLDQHYRWLEMSVRSSIGHLSDGIYCYYDPRTNSEIPCFDYLMGSAGIGMGILSSLWRDCPAWDVPLFTNLSYQANAANAV